MQTAERRGPLDEAVLRPTLCPLCVTDRFDREVYAMNFAVKDLDRLVFSARRQPDRLHYRMVRCKGCGLLRSNPILTADALERLYSSSLFTYAEEARFTRKTYGAYLRRVRPFAGEWNRLLEIGCGSGIFLEEARQQGIREVLGIEPSAEATRHATEEIRPGIQPGLYDRHSFPASHFDVICAFQVFDHVPDPAAMVAACFEHLKPGGVALFINHDSGAWSARVLGERSPIVDVEHTVLFDRRTIRRIFEKFGFTVCEVFGVWNTYPLHYWTRLAPIPGALKSWFLAFLQASRLGRIPLALRAGNLGIIARKG